METPECTYYGENCSKSLDNWVAGDWFLSWLVNFTIGIALVAFLWWLLWFCFVYLRRDLCVDCFNEGETKRTKYAYRDTPVCGYHYDMREIASESTYECSKHGIRYDKQRRNGITIDICPEGCIFLDDGGLGGGAPSSGGTGNPAPAAAGPTGGGGGGGIATNEVASGGGMSNGSYMSLLGSSQGGNGIAPAANGASQPTGSGLPGTGGRRWRSTIQRCAGRWKWRTLWRRWGRGRC